MGHLQQVISGLTKKWLQGCESVDNAADLAASNAMIKMMPKAVAHHVRDHNPKTGQDPTQLSR